MVSAVYAARRARRNESRGRKSMARSLMTLDEHQELRRNTAEVAPAVEPRYDADAVQKALALALEMQSEHERLISESQVVAIGEEAGVDPEFVRRALALVAEGKTENVVVARRKTRRTSGKVQPLSRKAKRLVVTLPLLYGLGLFPILAAQSEAGSNQNLNLALIAIVPPLLVCLMGVHFRSKRLGALGGLVMGATVFLSTLFASSVHNWSTQGAFPAGLIMLSAGLFLGTFSGAAAQYAPPIYHRVTEEIARRFPFLTETP